MGNVQLALIPMAGIDWWTWSTALWGLRMTVEDHGMYFEWKFNVITKQLGEVGYGNLMQRRRDSVDTSKR